MTCPLMSRPMKMLDYPNADRIGMFEQPCIKADCPLWVNDPNAFRSTTDFYGCGLTTMVYSIGTLRVRANQHD